MPDAQGRDVDVSADELFGRALLAGIREQDPEIAARLEPGPEADRMPTRSQDEAAAALVEQIRKDTGQ